MLKLEPLPPSTPRIGRFTRTVALLSALALASVSVQASVLEACGFCPVDCPMHAAHGKAQDNAPEATAKPHCHGDRDIGHDDQDRLRRPPCKTSFTLAGSLLPPIILVTNADAAVVLAAVADVRADGTPPGDRRPSPETPPPILFV